MAVRNPQVVSVLARTRAFRLDIVGGTPFELLVALRALTSTERGETWVPRGLDACSPATRAALEAVGDPAGDLWLHLLGLALEVEADDAATFIEHIERMRPLELRRHLLGLYVPTWRRAAGTDTIERAARGDRGATGALTAAWHDYCEDSVASFDQILQTGPKQTKALVVAALQRFAAEFLAPEEERLRQQLNADAEAMRARTATLDPVDLIEIATGGYRHEHANAFERVVLFPHLAHAPAILLAEHRDVRLIGYAASLRQADVSASLVALGRAVGDPSRAAILARLREGEASLGELADSLGLAKSTVHHHVFQLRSARLITVRGNTQGTFYSLDEDGLAAAGEIFGSYLAPRRDGAPLLRRARSRRR